MKGFPGKFFAQGDVLGYNSRYGAPSQESLNFLFVAQIFYVEK